MAAAQAAGAVIVRDIGSYADAKKAAADAAGDAAGAEAWKEGGWARVGMQAVGVTIADGLDGGNALATTVSAGVASLAAGRLNELAATVKDSKLTGNSDIDRALSSIIPSVVATVLGGTAGGNAGAAAGYNVDRFNRMLDYDEKELIRATSHSDVSASDRLAKAGCYAVQRWAQFPEGSSLYKAAFVSDQDVRSLSKEISWAKDQQTQGYLQYGAVARLTDSLAATTDTPQYGRNRTINGAPADSTASAAPCTAGAANCNAGIRYGGGLRVDYVTASISTPYGGGSVLLNNVTGDVYGGSTKGAPAGWGFSVMYGQTPDIDWSTRGITIGFFLDGSPGSGSLCYTGLCGGTTHSSGRLTAAEFGVGLGSGRVPSTGMGGGAGGASHWFTVPGYKN